MSSQAHRPVRPAVARLVADEAQATTKLQLTEAKRLVDDKPRYKDAVDRLRPLVVAAVSDWSTDLESAGLHPNVDDDVYLLRLPDVERPFVHLARLTFFRQKPSDGLSPLRVHIVFATQPNENASDGWIVALSAAGTGKVALGEYTRWPVFGFDIQRIDATIERLIDSVRSVSPVL